MSKTCLFPLTLQGQQQTPLRDFRHPRYIHLAAIDSSKSKPFSFTSNGGVSEIQPTKILEGAKQKKICNSSLFFCIFSSQVCNFGFVCVIDDFWLSKSIVSTCMVAYDWSWLVVFFDQPWLVLIPVGLWSNMLAHLISKVSTIALAVWCCWIHRSWSQVWNAFFHTCNCNCIVWLN